MLVDYKSKGSVITFSCCKASLVSWCSQCIQMLWISNCFEVPPLWETAGFTSQTCRVFQKGLSKDLQLVSRVCCCFLAVCVSETCNFIQILFSKQGLRCSELVAERRPVSANIGSTQEQPQNHCWNESKFALSRKLEDLHRSTRAEVF